MERTTNRRMVTIAMMVAILLVALDTTIVSTAMPRIVTDLKGLNLFSWVFAIYTLTTAVTTPIYGKLSDLFGRKRVFVIGVALFVIGSMLSGAAQNMPQLVWFRAFQGIGAGAVFPVTFTIIGDLFPGEQRAKMQGVFSSVWGIAGLLGPLVGGLFVDNISWRWIFYINLPVGIVSILLVLAFLHEKFDKRDHKIDYWGAAVFTIGISSLLYALLSGGSTYAWNSPVTYTLFIGSAVFIGLFIYIESKVKEPMLPLSLFGIHVIAVSNIVGFVASFVLIGVNVYLPMWIQILLGHNAVSSGLTLMPMSIAWPLGSTLSGRYMYKIGSKTTAVFGSILVVAGSAWLLAVTLHSPYWYFVGIMVVIGLGMGYTTTPITVLIQSAVGWNMRGAATASSTFTRTLGQTVGVAVFGSLLNNSLAHYVASHSAPGVHIGNISGMLTAGSTAHLPPQVLKIIQGGLSGGLHLIFVVGFVVAILTFLSAVVLPTHSKVMAQQPQVEN